MISSENGRLFIYAWCHMCVDALCCLLLYQTHANAWLWIIGYHALAFALQPVFGLMIDRHPAIPAGKISILLILGAYTLQHFPTLAVSFAGVGNALFHIEGGYVSLHRAQRKIGPGGFFVGAGALGIGMALIFAKFYISAIPFLFVLFSASSLLLLLLTPISPALRQRSGAFHLPLQADAFYWLFAAILVRGYTGMHISVPIIGWQGILCVAVLSCAGKMTGGYIADRIGAEKTVLFAQIMAAFCMLVSYWLPFCRLAVIFLINLPMAVTLAALSDCFPHQTGMAFGLAPLALYIGYISMLLPVSTVLSDIWILAALLLGSAYFLKRVFTACINKNDKP